MVYPAEAMRTLIVLPHSSSSSLVRAFSLHAPRPQNGYPSAKRCESIVDLHHYRRWRLGPHLCGSPVSILKQSAHSKRPLTSRLGSPCDRGFESRTPINRKLGARWYAVRHRGAARADPCREKSYRIKTAA